MTSNDVEPESASPVSNLSVVHAVNAASPEAIPLELAEGQYDRGLDVTVLSYFPISKATLRELSLPEARLRSVDAGSRFDSLKLKEFLKTIRSLGPDILHTHHTWTKALSRVAFLRADRPIVVGTEHNDHRGYSFLSRILNGATIGMNDGIVYNSKNTRSSVRRWERRLLGDTPENVCYNGVDVEKIREKSDQPLPAERQEVAEHDTVVGTVGKLIKQKDHRTLLQGFARAAEELPDPHLVVVGRGPLEEELKAEAKNLGIAKDVTFTGFVDEDILFPLVDAMDIFVVSSLWEGFCNAAVEAMAAGTPVVASDIDPLPEVLGTDCARFFKAEDPVALASELRALAIDSKERERLARKARKRATSRYTLDRSVDCYLSVYERLLSR